MDDRLEHNLRCIEEGFAAVGFQPERRFPTGMQLYVSAGVAVLSLSAFSSEEGSWVVVFGSHPARVPVDRRGALAEAMARINYQQIIGNFELDLTDGEMRYRIGHATDVGSATPELVQRLVGYVLYVWGRFHGALLGVAYGGYSPEEAVRAAFAEPATQSSETPPQAEGASTAVASEPPVDVDALLREMGLTGPIGSLPGESRNAPPPPASETNEDRRNALIMKIFATDGSQIPPFPNAYVVPGTRLIAGEYPGAKDLFSARKKVRQLLDVGVTRVIDLTTPGELSPYEELLGEEAKELEVTVDYRRRSIRDVDVCTPEQMRIILDEIDAALSARDTVYVHCWGGAGRTGMVIGCWLVRHGRTGADALVEVQRLFETMSPAKLARHPEGSPQTPAQRRMVLEWGATHKAEKNAPSRHRREV